MIDFNSDMMSETRASKLLKKDFLSDNISHAYLFHGPKGVYKMKSAIEMAKAIHCKNNLCGKCKTCLEIDNKTHVDTHIFNDDGQIISVEFMKNLIASINMTSHSKFKIFILEKIERMNKESANSFLKILEEPPQNTIIIMTTENISSILATIISRVRPINFSAFSDEELQNYVSKNFKNKSVEKIKFVLKTSFGRPSIASKLLNDDEIFEKHFAFYNEVLALFEKNIVDRFIFVDTLLSSEEEDSFKMDLFFEYISQILREKLLLSEFDDEKMKVINCLSKIYEAGMLLKRNVNKKLLLENIILSL